MGLTLVVCHNLNIRKFYVYNLLVRGYLAVGILTLAEQPDEFWAKHQPVLVIMWGEPYQLEDDILAVRQHFNERAAIILVSRDAPSMQWLSMWKPTAYLPYLIDGRQLIAYLQPWLANGQHS